MLNEDPNRVGGGTRSGISGRKKFVPLSSKNLRASILSAWVFVKKNWIRVRSYSTLKPFDTGTVEGRGYERHRRALLSSYASLIAKVFAIGSLLISVPITLRYLGAEQFGLWMLITSFITVIGFADIGIGNGLLNIVAEAHGSKNKAAIKEAVGTSTLILSFVGLLGIIFFIILFPSINWGGVYNLHNPLVIIEAGQSTLILCSCIAISLPASIAQKVQLGFQEGFEANLWQALGSILMLSGIFIAVYQEAKLPWLVFAAVGGPTLALILNWVHQFCFCRKWLFPSIKEFKWSIARRILSLGAIFTWFQVVAFIGTTLDNVIITYYFGPEALAKYALMYKLLTGLLVAQLFSAGLWPAIAEALERGDLEWVKNTFNKMLKIFSVFGVISALIMGVGSHWIIKHWVGEEMTPSFWMAFGFAGWGFITNYFAAISSTLSNNSSIRKLTLLTTFAAFSALIIKLIFSHYLGVDSIIWGTVIGYGIVCYPGLLIVNKLINR